MLNADKIIAQIPVKLVEWLPCWRIIPSRFPPIDLFERVASVEDFNAVIEIEQLTNPRIREELGKIHLLPEEERRFGPGSGYMMAAFIHSLIPSRFTDGSFGVYYAGNTLNTAIAETKYHRENFLRNFDAPRIELDMRVLLANLKGELHDITGKQKNLAEIYHLKDYTNSQKLGKQLRGNGLASYGLRYNSVREAEGECVAVFRPSILSNCRQERHLCYVWNGKEISDIYRKQSQL